MSLDVDHSNAKLEPVRKFFEQFQIFAAAPRKLERKLMYSCFENGRKKISVIPSPRWFSISIAVADVERDLGVDAFNKRVDDLNTPVYILGKTGVVRLVDLDFTGAGADQFLQLHIHDAGKICGEGFFILIVFVFNPLHQRVRAGNAEFRGSLRESREKLKIIGQPQ